MLTTPLQVGANDDLAREFQRAGIVVLGEVHDNPTHHQTQASLVRALVPDALVFEMIAADVAREVTSEGRGDPARLAARLDWENRGWPDFAMYYPIFAAAPEARLFGAARPIAEVRRAMGDGAGAVFGPSASRFGLDRALPDAQLQTRTALQQEAHCNALPETLLPGMVEAQRLRDAAIAEATVRAFDYARTVSEAPRVVVITGNGHARTDWGVPALLKTYYGDAAPMILALGQFETDRPGSAPFDQTTTAPAPEREDPCAAFRK